MSVIQGSINRPIAVIAAVLMVIIFGVLALQRIPIQLAPDVSKPVVSVTTYWPGGSPLEVEREIVTRQEEKLKGIEGLVEMESSAQDGRAEITLEFEIGANMDRALLLVANRLDQVERYPDEALRPTISTSSLGDNPVAWFILTRTAGNERPVASYGDFVEDVIQERLERVPGVSLTNVYGGTEREMRIVIDPDLMARYRLTVPDVVQSLRAANASISAGDVDEGKRRYVVRAEGEFETVDQVRQVVLTSQESAATGRIGRVTVGDIADVRFDYKDSTAHIRFLGEDSLAVNAVRETGANVIETMKGIDQAVGELNQYALPQAGLRMRQVYDETVYIKSSIALVRQNIWVGGTLAALILLLFLRSLRATLIVSLAIPISVVAAFVAMAALGRSINVISLAGIAFAVGMVVDAAIVVLENIYRYRERGLAPIEAAYKGTKQVWSAVLVSALTTVLVFIPILVMELEAGQLFRDIAVAISVAVLASLVVSITVVPALSKTLLKNVNISESRLRLPVVDLFARLFAGLIMGYARTIIRSRVASLIVVGALVAGTAVASLEFLPKLEYLPEGNRNLIFGIMLPPPGYNLDTMAEIAGRVEGRVRHLWGSETGPEPEPGGPPKIRNYFFVALPNRAFFGAGTYDETSDRVGELIPILSQSLWGEPGTFGFFTQPSLFSRDIAGGRAIKLDISGPDLEDVVVTSQKAAGLVEAAYPRAQGNQMRPVPGLELGSPEVRVLPDRVRLADNGVSALALGQSIDAFNDGLRVAEITVDGRRTDLTLRGPENKIDRTQGIDNLPVVTASGQILPVSMLANVVITTGPTEVRHLERERTITLEIRPRNEVSLEEAIDTVQTQVIDKLRAEGLPAGVRVRMSGSAAELDVTFDAMVNNLVVAIVIVYLLMAVLFESFVYPFIIMLSVPLATAGGVLGLVVLNIYMSRSGGVQALDMLTMLGFIILVGIVVNNAILLVDQTLKLMREEGMASFDAICEATRNRLRPIFMSTLTSVFGMLPLVVFPGAGSELYRGLGSVVVGGLSLSAILTLLIIPPLLAIFLPKPEAAAAETVALRAAAE
ncbi:MAG TPA: efflux RND transporter permease subunit [Alphaproteobacteria bacterium]